MKIKDTNMVSWCWKNKYS